MRSSAPRRANIKPADRFHGKASSADLERALAGHRVTVIAFSQQSVLPPLAPGEVHVWHFKEPLESQIEALHDLLSKDEQERAGRFRHQQSRRLFIASRAILRRLLGGYLGASSGELKFTFTANGKPELGGVYQDAGLYFNVAHSGVVGVIAFARGRRVGIDVEHIKADCAVEEIAERYFSLAELEALRALPAAERVSAFYGCWARKEAYLKATGSGLSIPLDSFDVTVGAGQGYDIIASTSEGEAEYWLVESLDIGEECAAALATSVSNHL